MNKLSFKEIDEDGIAAIELFVDGKSISEIFKVNYPSLPYYNFEDDLPYFPPKKSSVTDFSRRIIGICSCGEYGCGNIRCSVKEKEDKVIWSNFDWIKDSDNKKIFKFDSKEYFKTINKILESVKNK